MICKEILFENEKTLGWACSEQTLIALQSDSDGFRAKTSPFEMKYSLHTLWTLYALYTMYTLLTLYCKKHACLRGRVPYMYYTTIYEFFKSSF